MSGVDLEPAGEDLTDQPTDEYAWQPYQGGEDEQQANPQHQRLRRRLGGVVPASVTRTNRTARMISIISKPHDVVIALTDFEHSALTDNARRFVLMLECGCVVALQEYAGEVAQVDHLIGQPATMADDLVSGRCRDFNLTHGNSFQSVRPAARYAAPAIKIRVAIAEARSWMRSRIVARHRGGQFLAGVAIPTCTGSVGRNVVPMRPFVAIAA